MKIRVSDLFEIMNRLQREIEKNLDDSVNIDREDYYWELSHDELYNPYEKPRDPTLGQLSEDWEGLLRLKSGKEVPVSYDLIRLAAILKIVERKSLGKW